jgi:GDP-L-fucose synthase
MFYERKTVLVTGGTGFVGSHVVEQLLKQGARVRVPVHHRQLSVGVGNVETVVADLTQEKDCLEAARGVDFIFHLAGAVGSAGVSPAYIMSAISTNLTLMSRVLHAAWYQNVERVLLCGSSTVYPAFKHAVNEEEVWDGPTHPTYFGYGWTHRYFEKLQEFVTSQSEVKIAQVRATAVYGRRDNFDPATSHVVPSLVRKAVEKLDPYEVWGTGEEVRDLLHVSDLARGCLLMLEKHANCDPVNIGYGLGTTIREVATVILKAAGHDNAQVKFNTSRPTAIPFRMVDTSKAKRILDFTPEISLEDGLSNTVEWYAANHGKQ